MEATTLSCPAQQPLPIPSPLPTRQLEKLTCLISQPPSQPRWPCDTVPASGHITASLTSDMSGPTPSPFSFSEHKCDVWAAADILCLRDN